MSLIQNIKKIKGVCLFMGLMLADVIILTVVLAVRPSFAILLNANGILLLSVSELVLIFPALPLYMLITRQSLTHILPCKPLGWKNAGYILLMTVLLEPAVSLLSALTSLFYPNAAVEITSLLPAGNLPAAVFVAAVLPAIVEETCFRGAILSASNEMNVYGAVALNGILFGLMHMNMQQIPYALFLGVILSLFVIYTQSLFSSMLAHFLINAPGIVFGLLNRDNQGPPPSLDELLQSVRVLTVAALLFFGGFLIVYKRFRLYNINQNHS